MKKSKEYRYQFLGYEEVETGEFKEIPYSFGFGLAPLSQNPLEPKEKSRGRIVKVMETVASIFDKQTGLVKQTKIKKIYK